MAANPKTKAQIEAERKRKARSPARPPNVSRADQEKGFAKGAKKALANMSPAERRAFEKSAKGSAQRALQSDKDDKTLKTPPKSAKRNPGASGKRQQANFNAGVKGALANMDPAQKRAYEKSLGESAASATRKVKEDKFLKSGGTKSRDYAKPPKAKAKPPAGPAKAQTFDKAFAEARKAQGAGGTFTYNGKKFTTDRADDKPANAPVKAPVKAAKAPEKKGFFKNLGDKLRSATTKTPGRPRKPSGKKPMRTPSTGPWAKYDAAMKKFRKDQEASKAKAGGGRVTAKKPAAKKKVAKAKKPIARASVKRMASGGRVSDSVRQSLDAVPPEVAEYLKMSGYGRGYNSGAKMTGGGLTPKKAMNKKPTAKKIARKKPSARTTVNKKLPRRP